MKHTYIATAIAVALAIAIPLVVLAGNTVETYKVEVEKEKIVYTPEPKLSPAQIIWLAQLMNCESDTKVTALNPADSNGLPSRNILQFQDATYAGFTKLYGIDTSPQDSPQTISENQVRIVTEWLLNPGTVRWQRQFPACVEKLGVPPVQ
jgi:hypothetical protein